MTNWFALPLLFLGLTVQAAWFDQSHEIFMTEKLSAVASKYRDYPLFWWNFIVVDGKLTREEVEKLCADLWRENRGAIAKLPCAQGPESLQSLTTDWLKDLPRRRDWPGEAELSRAMNSGLVKASLPIPREVLNLLRSDPMNSLGDLRRQLDARARFNAPVEGGTIFESNDNRRWLPIQFAYSPADSARTIEFERVLGESQIFGPHASTVENEMRIRADIGAVSIVGTIALVLLVGFILYTRRHRLIYLLPILGLGLGISTMLTVLWFGSIHAITLAFGPGIAGLAMDYGVHAVFMNPRARETWKSNLAGLVTTLVILFLLLFSAIPLLRQMMFFSILGLTISFALFYFFLSRWPDKFVTKPYDFSPRSWRPGEAVALAMLFAAPLLFLRPVELSLQHMNFESPKTVELRHAFMKISASPSPYWLDLDSLEASEEARVWAAGQKIVFEGAANFLPPVARQERHLQTWRAALCPNENLKLSETQRRFYQPFLASIACGNLRPRPFADPLPNYLSDFRNQDRSIGLLFPTTPEQVAAVRGKYPDSSTPRALFEAFPRVFMNELAWTTPIALLGAFLFLWLHFRRGRLAFLATVPFLTGVGCFAAMAFVFDLPLTFISLIGLLMVFGFSLDYGIFVVTLMGSDGEHKFGVWSALSVCSFSTLAGFVPLVFAGHPVLRDLGHMLLWGSLGTYIGTFWGIPALMRRRA